jgi:hypothetical protein
MIGVGKNITWEVRKHHSFKKVKKTFPYLYYASINVFRTVEANLIVLTSFDPNLLVQKET